MDVGQSNRPKERVIETLDLEPEERKCRGRPGCDWCLRQRALGAPVWRSQGVRSTSNSLGVRLALEEMVVLWD